MEGLAKEANNIRSESMRLAWYMRGGATYSEVLQMSYQERKIINDLAKDNIETTKKTKLPWF